MAYAIKGKNGQPLLKDGASLMGSDLVDVKIEQLDEVNLTFIAAASTEHEDRDKDIIRQSGWVLANFKRNPVVPLAHNYYALPVARSMKTWVDESNKVPRLLFKPQFDSADELSVKVFNKYRKGFLTSFSVGFKGIEFTERDPNDWWGGKEFTKQELLEISVVPVPANPHANVHLSYPPSRAKTIAEHGYPEVFSKNPDGQIFLPVRDVWQFSTPQVVNFGKGISVIMGAPFGKDHPETGNQLVGYMFEKDFDGNPVEWVKQFGNLSRKQFYCKVNEEEVKDKKSFSFDIVTEDSVIEVKNLAVKDLPWKASDEDVKVKQSLILPEEEPVIDLDALELESQGGTDQDDKKTDPNPPQPAVPDKKTDATPNDPASELIVTLTNGMADLSRSVAELSTSISAQVKEATDNIKKLLEKPNQIADNNLISDDPLKTGDPNGKGTPQPDESFELGDDLLEQGQSPEDDSIEVEGADMQSVKDSVATGVKESIGQQIRTCLTEAIKNSGKID